MTSCEEALRSLPPKHQKTRKERVKEMMPVINETKEKGYNYLEIRKILDEQGIDIALSTLKKYVQHFNKAAAQKHRPNVLTLSKPQKGG